MKEVHALVVLLVIAIVVGLVLRYGATSVPLAQTTETGAIDVLNDLTLKCSGYTYESPKGKS